MTKTETNDFALINKDQENWTQTEFVEYDVDKFKFKTICLWVDWRDKTTMVDVQICDCFELMYDVCSTFEIPIDTDFEEFPSFFAETIQPILQKIGAGWDYYYENSNMHGKFTADAIKTIEKLEIILGNDGNIHCDVPTHDIEMFVTVDELYNFDWRGRAGILEDLKENGFDLFTADLNDKETIDKAVNILTSGDGVDYVIIGSVDDEVKDILRDIKDEMICCDIE